jgi:succinyl-CoA--D-citramalate CoA-transferase
MSTRNGVYAGWTVVELCRGFGAGTLAAKLLADLGCVVGKIETPAGDPLRGEGAGGGASPLALSDLVDGGKHLACVDVDAVGAPTVLDALLGAADILIVDRWGLAVLDACGLRATLAQRRPDLVVAACTPYGSDGEYADWAATEECVQALSGVMATTGHPGRPPVRVAGAIVTHTAAMHTVTSVLAQMHARSRGAGGATLDVALFDAAISLLTAGFPSYFLSGESPRGIGNRHSMAAPWNTYPCRDGWVVVCAGNETTWQRLVAAIARPDLAAHPDYATQALRVANVDALDAEIGAWTRERSVAGVEAILDRQGIPCGAILALSDVLAHPQTATRDLLRHDGAGATAGGVFRVDHHALAVRRSSRQIGSGTRALFVERMGIDPQRYRQWLDAGVLRDDGGRLDVAAA